ncbi:hypothetical protein ACIBL6_15590 [Streptomyces sp. NPDC050400]|uniref:hypothetical protein n=1 Tax=Streptomyces sp. NPDC050400 TaxID=3365610 RepID=UPI0037BC1840
MLALASVAGMARVSATRCAASPRGTPQARHPAAALITEQLQQRRTLRRYRAWLLAVQDDAA